MHPLDAAEANELAPREQPRDPDTGQFQAPEPAEKSFRGDASGIEEAAREYRRGDREPSLRETSEDIWRRRVNHELTQDRAEKAIIQVARERAAQARGLEDGITDKIGPTDPNKTFKLSELRPVQYDRETGQPVGDPQKSVSSSVAKYRQARDTGLVTEILSELAPELLPDHLRPQEAPSEAQPEFTPEPVQEPPAQPSEIEQERTRLALELEQTRVARQQYEQALPQVASLAFSDLTREAQELRRAGYSSFQELSNADPQRAIRYMQRTQEVQALIQETQAQQHRQQTVQAAQWKEFAAREDAEFERIAGKDWTDPAKRNELTNAVVDFVRDSGGNINQFYAEYSRNPAVRSARAQMMLMKAALAHKAQKGIAAKRVAPQAGPVQRPGPAPARSSQYSEFARIASEVGSGELDLKSAARLRGAALRSARR